MVSTICSDKSDQKYQQNTTCPNTKSNKKNKHCQDSCSTPGNSCTACTNLNYFLCSGHCLHPDLVCDGHAQCEEGEDEDIKLCEDTWRKKKIIEAEATFECELLYPPGPTMRTLALRFDERPTCSGKADEPGCEGEWISLGWMLVIILVLTVISSTCSQICKGDKRCHAHRIQR